MAAPTAQEFAALQNMVTLLQQQLNQLQPPPPPPAAPPPIPKVAKPFEFSGKSEQLEDFIHQCTLFLDLDQYSDRSKITFVLSYMKSGSALTWATQKLAEYSTANWVVVWADFLTQLRGTFGDVDRTKTARINIFEIKQGNKSVDDYNVAFMAKHTLSGFSDEASLEIWKKGLKVSILRRIYNEDPGPTDFAGWRTRASHYDRVDKELQARSVPTSSSSSKPRYIPATTSIPSSSKSSSTSTSSAPVKVKQERVDPTIAAQRKKDGQCILCGSPDHWANICPKRITPPVHSMHKLQGRGRGGYKGKSGSWRTVNVVDKKDSMNDKNASGST